MERLGRILWYLGPTTNPGDAVLPSLKAGESWVSLKSQEETTFSSGYLGSLIYFFQFPVPPKHNPSQVGHGDVILAHRDYMEEETWNMESQCT